MKLIHLSEYKGYVYDLEELRLQCASGMSMSQCIHSVQKFCHEGARDKSKSAVIWDSRHHEIVLWFEDKKYMTYFSLKMERKGV